VSAFQAHHDLYGWELDLLLDAIHSHGDPAAAPAGTPAGAPAPGGDPFAAPPSSLSEL
jgi:hypothetical protein